MDPRNYEKGAIESPPDAPISPSNGYPTDGNPQTGQSATLPGAHWFYKVGESLRKVIIDAGLIPDDSDLELLSKAIPKSNKLIGEPFAVFEHLAGVEAPSNEGSVKYVMLTAGEDGVGSYNEGLLTNETITGSGDTIEVTAEVADPQSPMFGETIHLLNSEDRYVKPGEISGQIANDQMQKVEGVFGAALKGGSTGSSSSLNGPFSEDLESGTDVWGSGTGRVRRIRFNSADVARTGTRTDTKHMTAVYYLRIR